MQIIMFENVSLFPGHISGEISFSPINLPIITSFRLCKCIQCQITGLDPFLNHHVLKILIVQNRKKNVLSLLL